MLECKNLIILGNGFDLDHKLKTSYGDFGEYLEKNSGDYVDIYLPPDPIKDPKGGYYFNDEELNSFFYTILSESGIEENWSDFEECLGNLDFNDYIKSDSEIKEYSDAEDNEDSINSCLIAFGKLTEVFSNWLKNQFEVGLKTCNIKDKFKNMLNAETSILNFNYTDTVEKLYRYEKVFHIHGELNNCTRFPYSNNIILGHSEHNDDYFDYPMGAEGIPEIYDSLKKDTGKVLRNSSNFFNSLIKVEKIYSYGFSFSNPDLAYIKEICKKIKNEDAIWYLNDNYKEHDNVSAYRNKLKQNGFKGKIETWKA